MNNYFEEEQKLLKQLEELRQKKLLETNAKKYKTHIIDKLETDINRNEDTIKKLQDENLQLQDKLAELKSIDDDNDIMVYLADCYADEVNELINSNKTKQVKPTKKQITNYKKTTPEQRWELIEKGSMFIAKHKGVVRYYYKGFGGCLNECDEDGELNLEIDDFENIQEAASNFRKNAGITYYISGWELLQLYNKDTRKKKSLKKWDGELEYLKW